MWGCGGGGGGERNHSGGGNLGNWMRVDCCRYVEVFEANPLDVEKAKDREMGGGGRGYGGGGRDRGRRSGGGRLTNYRLLLQLKTKQRPKTCTQLSR